jgi:hypothetical protein
MAKHLASRYLPGRLLTTIADRVRALGLAVS